MLIRYWILLNFDRFLLFKAYFWSLKIVWCIWLWLLHYNLRGPEDVFRLHGLEGFHVSNLPMGLVCLKILGFVVPALLPDFLQNCRYLGAVITLEVVDCRALIVCMLFSLLDYALIECVSLIVKLHIYTWIMVIHTLCSFLEIESLAFVDRWASVFAIGAFAQGCARHTSLKALTILLLALTSLALAPLEVHVLVRVYLWLEGVDIALKNLLDCFLAVVEMLIVVVALASLPRTLTGRTACGVVTQALAI